MEPLTVKVAPTGPCVKLNDEIVGGVVVVLVSEKFAVVPTPETDPVTV